MANRNRFRRRMPSDPSLAVSTRRQGSSSCGHGPAVTSIRDTFVRARLMSDIHTSDEFRSTLLNVLRYKNWALASASH